MNYLLNVTNVYRVPTVEDALKLREELQKTSCGELTSFSYTTKYIKVKGEVVEEYQLVKAKIEFTPEKEPEVQIYASYSDGLEF
jgi:hypothetical protein